MRLTKKKAIELSIELWEWLKKTGKYKYEWPRWDKYGEMLANCFLCQWSVERTYKSIGCGYCPIAKKFKGNCETTFYWKWNSSITEQDRKKYASLFLAQLKEIQNGTDTR